MTSIGLSAQQVAMFPAQMILSELDLRETIDPRERELVEKYQALLGKEKENDRRLDALLARKGWFARLMFQRLARENDALRRRRRRIENSPALGSLLFRKRYQLLAERREKDLERIREVERIRWEMLTKEP